MGSYHDAFHLKPISMDASPVYSTDENDFIDNANFYEKEQELNDIFSSNSVSTSNNLNFEMGSYNDAFHFKPISFDESSIDSVDEIDIIDNANFGEEDKEMNDITNSNSISSSNNPNFVLRSYNDDYHFKPVSEDTLPVNSTNENEIIDNANLEREEKKQKNVFNSNSASTPNIRNLVTGYYNEGFKFTPTPTVKSPDTPTEENANENTVDSSQRKSVFKKMKSFFKKVVTRKRNSFSYKRF
ncbi:hypothetical protein TNCV_2311711 [Trichonephila clavipes]|nr:hypothetical protein TNCV_2311711 [Trichonephila clavipes]